MKRVALGATVLVASYLLAWTIVYMIIMQGDVGYLFSYLVLAWTDPGEIPAMINLFAVIVGLALALAIGIAWVVARRFGWRRNPLRTEPSEMR